MQSLLDRYHFGSKKICWREPYLWTPGIYYKPISDFPKAIRISPLFYFLSSGLCPAGQQYTTNCFVDPCTVNSCPAYPNARCVSNYCGGCNAVFYDNNNELTVQQCTQGMFMYKHRAGVSRRHVKIQKMSKFCNFVTLLWNHHEKCIQISTNMPSIVAFLYSESGCISVYRRCHLILHSTVMLHRRSFLKSNIG